MGEEGVLLGYLGAAEEEDRFRPLLVDSPSHGQALLDVPEEEGEADGLGPLLEDPLGHIFGAEEVRLPSGEDVQSPGFANRGNALGVGLKVGRAQGDVPLLLQGVEPGKGQLEEEGPLHLSSLPWDSSLEGE